MFDRAQDFVTKTAPGSQTEWAVRTSASGFPEVYEDAGTLSGQPLSGAQLNPKWPIINYGPVDPKGMYLVRTYRNGKVKAEEYSPLLRTADTVAGGLTQYNPREPGGAAASGGVAPSQATPRIINNQGGGQSVATAAQLEAGQAATPIPNSVGTGDVTTSVKSVPGNPPETNRVQKGGAVKSLAAPKLPAPTAPLGNTPNSPAASPTPAAAAPAAKQPDETWLNSNDPIAINTREYLAGNTDKLSEKQMQGVRMGASAHNIPLPNVLTGAAQKDIAAVDDVLGQIKMLKTELERRGLDKNHTSDYYPEYFKYSHLGDTDNPESGFWTGLSFGIQFWWRSPCRMSSQRQKSQCCDGAHLCPDAELSPSAILHGKWHTPDTGAQMYGKLGEMERVLSNKRASIKGEDESKNGIIKPQATASSSSESKAPAPTHRLNGRPIALNPKNDSQWIYTDTGEVVK